MKKEETLILGREDMIEGCQHKDIDSVEFTDFSISIKPIQTTGIILFIDDNGKTKIMKNRYGDKANTVPHILDYNEINVNLHKTVVKQAVSIMEEMVNGTYHDDNDDDHFMYESVMIAVYGPKIFDWINKNVR